jgi:hypothetical protein
MSSPHFTHYFRYHPSLMLVLSIKTRLNRFTS